MKRLSAKHFPAKGSNHALESTAASALRLLAAPPSLRSSAAGERERWASEERSRGGEYHSMGFSDRRSVDVNPR